MEDVTPVTKSTKGTRTFTQVEEDLVVRGLLAIRPTVTDDERKVIDGIFQGGWER